MTAQQRWFASDNNASTHPLIMEALARANSGHAVGYGDDPVTQKAETAVAALFRTPHQDAEPLVRFVLNGTGANVYALGCLAGHGDAIFCSDCAHIMVDETGAPTAVTGAQIVPLPSTDGKLSARALAHAVHEWSDMHKAKPTVLSLSQPTELGTVYSHSELSQLCGTAHRLGMSVHIDGARLANAAAALGCSPAEAAGDADVVCFGGTKNGLMFGEAVVFMPAILEKLGDTARLRKTRLQLASKMRYIAAQFLEYLHNDLWLSNAMHANAMAARLADGARKLGLSIQYPVQANGLFVRVNASVADELKANAFFYDWEGGLVRWMASWDTTEEDVDSFLQKLAQALKARQSKGPARSEAETEALHAELLEKRLWLKADWNCVDSRVSDQSLGYPSPPFTQPVLKGTATIELPDTLSLQLGNKTIAQCVRQRKSRRAYSSASINLTELSYLLWSCAGVREAKAKYAFRTVPSAGCRHPLDTLVYARNVASLAPGLYRYQAEQNRLALLRAASPIGSDQELSLDAEFAEATLGQLWNCAALFCWTAIPYRTEWRYTSASAKLIALDAGHACQALYMACEALELGTCAVGAYDQNRMDQVLGVDGIDEFAVYMAPVGRPKE